MIIPFLIVVAGAICLGWLKRCRYLDDPTPADQPLVDALDRALGEHHPHPTPPASFKEHAP